MHAFIRFVLERLVRLFYHTISVSGAGRIPASGPVIVVANHPNGLIDPVILGLGLDRPVAFLAKSTFFSNPVARVAMDAFGAIPVFRASNGAATGKNEETFARCRALLAHQGWVALFPEGTTHDETTLKPFKSGAARIALSALEEAGPALGLQVLPVGLMYEDKQVFRSRVALGVGEPFDLAAYLDEYKENPRGAVQKVTGLIQESLGQVTLEAENHALWRGFVAVAAWTNPDAAGNLAAREERARELAAAYHRLVASDPDRADEVIAFIRRFVRMLQAVGIDDPFRLDTGDKPGVAAVTASLLQLLLLLPLALIGALFGWLPYRLVRPLANKLSGGKVELIGTIKLLLGVVILTISYVSEAALAGNWLGWPTGLATLVLAPLTGLVALRFDERLALRRESLRAYWLRATQAGVAEEIKSRRRELSETVELALGKTAGT